MPLVNKDIRDSTLISWNYVLQKGQNKQIHELECKFSLKLKYKPTSNVLSNYYFMMKIRRFLLDGTSTNNYLKDDEFLWCENHKDQFFYSLDSKTDPTPQFYPKISLKFNSNLSVNIFRTTFKNILRNATIS
ncbi:hypothetical protein TYRP_020880 [Tyrophagus putrescentiae]|nr:hypothetical protein TYRP_020880 [Tyrophagus putrescentiae]